MHSKIYLCFFTLLLFHCTSGQRDKKFFRQDYQYIESVQNFYKIHTIGRPWLEAKRTCELEGATFFYPESEAESAAVRAYVKQQHNQYYFWIGISSLFATGFFITFDGLPISEVYHKWAQGDPNNLGGDENCVVLEYSGLIYDGNCANNMTFVCKKTLNSLTWNTDCNMPYTDYKYNSELGKCYKIYLTPQNWTEAYRICASRLSYLTIIDSPGEKEFLLDQLDNAAPEGETGNDYQKGQFFVGIHQLTGEGWRTVKGASLKATNGYTQWDENQPDSHGVEQCGSIIIKKGGGHNDLRCHHKCFFVCEHDVKGGSVVPTYQGYGNK